jgi:hypothetical protein
VFSSVYLSDARNFLEALNFKAEEEKMAVIIQEVAGWQTCRQLLLSPHLWSSTILNNFYPTAHMTHTDGIAT